MCIDAGMEGFYSNHSLRATAATRMYSADLPEQLICEKTGHRSEAVRSYKRTSSIQCVNASDAVQGVKRKSDNVPVISAHVSDYVPNPVAGSVKIKRGDMSVEIHI